MGKSFISPLRWELKLERGDIDRIGAGIVSLEERYKDDPELLAFYQKKLLIPGCASELAPYELAYIKSQLRQSPSLRRRWGFRPSAKRLSESRIRAVARDGL